MLPSAHVYEIHLNCDICHWKDETGVFQGILGLGGKASKNKLKDTCFLFPMTNVTVLGVFCMHAQKEYGKVLEIKNTPILNILALLLFLN